MKAQVYRVFEKNLNNEKKTNGCEWSTFEINCSKVALIKTKVVCSVEDPDPFEFTGSGAMKKTVDLDPDPRSVLIFS